MEEDEAIDPKLQAYVNQLMQAHNQLPVADFQGYSPDEMGKLLYQSFEPGGLLQLKTLQPEEYEQIPLFRLVQLLALRVSEAGALKLTQTGALPTKLVSELYRLDPRIQDRIIPPRDNMKEADTVPAHLSRIMLEICGIAKKRHNKLSLTKAGEKLLGQPAALLQKLILVYCYKFNWAYFDGYGGNAIGQAGFGFSLALLSKWGKEERIDHFYAKKYFQAFPHLLDPRLKSQYTDLLTYCSHAYSLRTFDRFGLYFGLLTTNKPRWDTDKLVVKTELFDKLIQCTPPNGKL